MYNDEELKPTGHVYTRGGELNELQIRIYCAHACMLARVLHARDMCVKLTQYPLRVVVREDFLFFSKLADRTCKRIYIVMGRGSEG